MASASSWLTNLASKAENVLNQIDESAATVLHHPNSEHTTPTTSQSLNSTSVLSPHGVQSSQDNSRYMTKHHRSEAVRSSKPFKHTQSRSRRKVSTNSVDGDMKSAETAENVSHSRPSSVSSVKSNRSEGATPLYVDPFASHFSSFSSPMNDDAAFGGSGVGKSKFHEQDLSPKSGNGSGSHVTSASGSSYLQIEPHVDEANLELGEEAASNISIQMVTSLKEENKLLKSELRSLTQELNSALSRYREMENKMKRLNQDYDLKSQEVNEMFRKLQNVESDLSEEIRAKDSQISGYRLKVNELSDKISSQNDAIQKLNNEKLQILSDHQSSSGLHEESVSQLQSQLQQAQVGFNSQVERERQEKKELEERLYKMEDNLQALTAEIRDLNQKLQNEKQINSDYQRQMSISKQSLEEARNELTEYKSKAVKILQSKEKLIADMKASFGDGSFNQTNDNVASNDESMTQSGHSSQYEMMKMELKQYKYECELLRDEMSRLSGQLERAREDLAMTEASNNQQHATITQHLNSTHNALQQEKHKVTMLEDDLLRSREELNATSRELIHVKENLSQVTSERNEQISRLESELNSLRSRSLSSTNDEYESRIKTLTDTLLTKQSQIERLNSEKQSLNFQLERLALQNSNSSRSGGSSTSTRLNIGSSGLYDDENFKGRAMSSIPSFCRESAFDGQVVKFFKRSLVAIDSLSLSIGVYFRRFALARVFIIIYALLLHLWVTVVIMTYKPEMHSDDFHPVKLPTLND